jgi:hypothetical protein
MARSVTSFGALFLTLAIFILSAAAERRARLVPQRRTDYNGGWALAVPGSTCPADASVACSTNGGYVNPTCCPSGQTCFGYASPYCCPSSKSSLSQHSNKRSLPSLPLEKLAADESCLLPKQTPTAQTSSQTSPSAQTPLGISTNTTSTETSSSAALLANTAFYPFLATLVSANLPMKALLLRSSPPLRRNMAVELLRLLWSEVVVLHHLQPL